MSLPHTAVKSIPQWGLICRTIHHKGVLKGTLSDRGKLAKDRFAAQQFCRPSERCASPACRLSARGTASGARWWWCASNGSNAFPAACLLLIPARRAMCTGNALCASNSHMRAGSWQPRAKRSSSCCGSTSGCPHYERRANVGLDAAYDSMKAGSCPDGRV